MKILMLNYEFPPLGGGASPFTHDLAVNLSKNGKIKIDLVTMNYKGLMAKENYCGITIYRVPCFRLKKEISRNYEMLSYIVSASFKAAQLLKTYKYDLIHSHFIVPSGISAYIVSKLSSVRYIISSHGSDVPGYNPDRFILLHRLIRPIWNRVVENSELIVVPSQSLKELLNRSMRTSKKIAVIPYGFDAYKILPSENKSDQILMVGRLLKRKGFQYVLQALAGIKTNYKIKVIGEGPFKNNLIKLSKNLNLDTDFTGWLEGEELYRQYSQSKIFAMPSDSESFGMVFTEAMAGGCAIIYARGSSGDEVVGQAGISVESENVSEIKNKILYLINNPEKITMYGKLGRQKLEKDYLWQNISDLYVNIYEVITKSHNKKLEN